MNIDHRQYYALFAVFLTLGTLVVAVASRPADFAAGAVLLICSLAIGLLG